VLICENSDGSLGFRTDPIDLFEDIKTEMAMTVQSFHRNQAHGIVHQVGKDKEVWVRLQAQIESEMKVRERLATAR